MTPMDPDGPPPSQVSRKQSGLSESLGDLVKELLANNG